MPPIRITALLRATITVFLLVTATTQASLVPVNASQGDYPSILCELNLTQGNPGDQITEPVLVERLSLANAGYRFIGDRYYRGQFGGVIAALVYRDYRKTAQSNIQKPNGYVAASEFLHNDHPTHYLEYGLASVLGFPRLNVNSSKTYYFMPDEIELNGFFDYLGQLIANDPAHFPVRYVSVSQKLTPKAYLQLLAKHKLHPVAAQGYLRIHDISAHWAINFIAKEAVERALDQISLLLDFSEWLKNQPVGAHWNELQILSKESMRVDFANFNWLPVTLSYDTVPDEDVKLKALQYFNEFMAHGAPPKTYVYRLINGLDIESSQKAQLLTALNTYCNEHGISAQNVRTIQSQEVWTETLKLRKLLQLMSYKIYTERALPLFRDPKLIL